MIRGIAGEYTTWDVTAGQSPMEVEPQAARYRSEVTPDGYRVVIPVTRNWFVILFMYAWLTGWAFGELNVSAQLARGGDKMPAAFLSFWLVCWTLGGLLWIATLIWQLAGREVVSIGPTMLSYRGEAFGLGRTSSFRLATVKDLRPTADPVNILMYRRSWLPPIFGVWPRYGSVAFDYGARTFRIAPSLDEAEAKLLVKELSAHLPDASRRSPET